MSSKRDLCTCIDCYIGPDVAILQTPCGVLPVYVAINPRPRKPGELFLPRNHDCIIRRARGEFQTKAGTGTEGPGGSEAGAPDEGLRGGEHRFLKRVPKFLQELEAAGKLKSYLQELGRQAAEMREEVEGSMRAQAVKPGLGLSQSDLEERLRMIPQVADEIVDHDLILAAKPDIRNQNLLRCRGQIPPLISPKRVTRPSARPNLEPRNRAAATVASRPCGQPRSSGERASSPRSGIAGATYVEAAARFLCAVRRVQRRRRSHDRGADVWLILSTTDSVAHRRASLSGRHGDQGQDRVARLLGHRPRRLSCYSCRRRR